MTRVLLDTNILIHREGTTAVRDDIGTLFYWLDRLKIEKCIHPGSVEELRKHGDAKVVHTLEVKLKSYVTLKTIAADDERIESLRGIDKSPNDQLDTSLVAQLAAGRVDLLITEDRGIHRKAAQLGLAEKVFTIDAFLEKATAENPGLADYRVLSVRKVHFGNLDIKSPFFDSFRTDYPAFSAWFARKADEFAYVCTTDDNQLVAFLYVKLEGQDENYSDISPTLKPGRRLKIGTLKVVSNGYKLGERFLRIAFENAMRFHADEVYVTIYRRTPEQDRLYRLLEDWGFKKHGVKTSAGGNEDVLVRNFRPEVNLADPRRSYPYMSMSVKKFVVPIYPAYHTELLPDSILRTESPEDFVESKPNRNAISKVYISRSIERGLSPGDIIVFYRTKSDSGPGHYTSVATTLGIVQGVTQNIKSLDEFIAVCRKRSVFSDAELAKHWNWSQTNRPFVVSFLYAYSLPKRPNLKDLKEARVLADAPRGFELIGDKGFLTLMEISGADKRLIVD